MCWRFLQSVSSRRESFSTLLGFAAGALALNQVVVAAEEAEAPLATPNVGPAPTSYDLSRDYYKDASQMLQHMKYVHTHTLRACFLNRGGRFERGRGDNENGEVVLGSLTDVHTH